MKDIGTEADYVFHSGCYNKIYNLCGVQIAITYFSHCGGCEVKIKASASLGSGEDSPRLADCQLHAESSHGRKDKLVFRFPFYTLHPQGSTLMT